jgi:hypothetical protein
MPTECVQEKRKTGAKGLQFQAKREREKQIARQTVVRQCGN